jgi:PIN domain nuclease of toxin-antitoxin system
MKVLLDTHVWLWMWGEPERLRNEARSVLEDPATVLHVSAVTAWEMATKASSGRLRLPTSPDVWLSDSRHRGGVTELPITFDHATRAGSLPLHHRDPFDRMLVAQAQAEGLVLVTADRQLAPYEIDRLPA